MTIETKEPTRFREMVTALVRRDARDLTLRQLAILMTTENCATVRGLAAELRIQKPAVTRAIQRLHEMGFISRAIDPNYHRSVLLSTTYEVIEFIETVGVMQEAA